MKHFYVENDWVRDTRCDTRLSECPILRNARIDHVEYDIETIKPAEEYKINIGTNKPKTHALCTEYTNAVNFLCNSCVSHHLCKR